MSNNTSVNISIFPDGTYQVAVSGGNGHNNDDNNLVNDTDINNIINRIESIFDGDKILFDTNDEKYKNGYVITIKRKGKSHNHEDDNASSMIINPFAA